jgi:FtsP/CotA-like multicopper oxidase with cupredoxin domain
MSGGRWALLAVGLAVLVGLFLLVRPDEPEPTGTATPTPTATETAEPTPTGETPEPTPTPDAVEIEVEEGTVRGPNTIKVAQGDRVAIDVEADVEDHVHVHGYDLLTDIAPGQRVTIEFRATIPGVFEIELEDSHLLLARLEVTP